MSRQENQTFPDFLHQDTDTVARLLLGCELEREIDGTLVRVRIVETESYDQDDAASHSYGGKRGRNTTLYEDAGQLYVYFTYGMHYCCNIVAGSEGYGASVLIRAAEPIDGQEVVESRRGMTGPNATNGPAKFCQALGIDRGLNGHDLRTGPLRLYAGGLQPGERIATSPRIGISRARDVHRRFFIADNPYLSRK